MGDMDPRLAVGRESSCCRYVRALYNADDQRLACSSACRSFTLISGSDLFLTAHLLPSQAVDRALRHRSWCMSGIGQVGRPRVMEPVLL